MGRRALLIGSQTGSLTGVHRDVDAMADALGVHGFEVRTVTGPDASSAGILTAYRELIGDAADGDAVVVYYSGHGGRSRNPASGGAPGDPAAPAVLQYVVPTDIDDRSGGTFRGILTEELSELQRALTERTRNVTTIVDCCHAARMFRDPGIVPKATDADGFPWADVEARWRRVRADAGTGLGDTNPWVVQVVACEPDQSAYELADSSLGGTHGALTAALVSVLRRPDALALSWREVIEIVRRAVLDVVPTQRPDVLGPQAERLLFSLATKDTTGVLGVVEVDGQLWVERAELFGVAVNDSFALVPPGGDVRRPLAVAVVDALVGDRGRLLVADPLELPLPDGVLAHPLAVGLGRRPVVVSPADHPDRATVVEAFRRSPTVRIRDDDGSAGALATVALGDDGADLLDAQGEPLWVAPRPVTDATLTLLGASLTKLARATHVRDLPSGVGAARLPDDGEHVVALTFARLDPTSGAEIAIAPGEHLHVDDAIVLRARNATAEKRYLSVIDVGLTGAVTILTAAQPSGTTIEPGDEYVVGENAAHVVEGVRLFWPDGLPTGAPRAESLIVLVADRPIDGLTALAQTGLRTRSAHPPRNAIERLLDGLGTGTRDVAPLPDRTDEARYRVHRFDFLLHPTPRPGASAGTGSTAEPPFEIDARPDPSFRLVVPRGTGRVPDRLSIRLAELTVHSNRSLLAAKVRVDFLVVTAAGDSTVAPFAAESQFFDRVRDGDRLPLDNLLIYDGPVGRFVDLAVWVSKADDRETALADLLKAELDDAEVAGAITTLGALAIAAPPAAAIAGSAAAVATLVRTGARVLSAVVGTSIGVYRTSFLPHERFGAGEPARRHPAGGVITAQDMSFALELIDAGAPPAG